MLCHKEPQRSVQLARWSAKDRSEIFRSSRLRRVPQSWGSVCVNVSPVLSRAAGTEASGQGSPVSREHVHSPRRVHGLPES